MDYIFRRLALDYLSFESRSALGIYSAEERQRHLETGSYEPLEETGSAAELIEHSAGRGDQEPAGRGDQQSAGRGGRSSDRHETPEDVEEAEIVITDKAPDAPHARTSAELLEQITGHAVDSPLCMTCGTKMRPAGSCYVCEGCGSTSGCS
jgi:ribonucleoside-diphosphate reductase alpha chain